MSINCKTKTKKNIRVLHVFSPDYKQLFGGQRILWKKNFSKWHHPEVVHYFLDCADGKLIDPVEAFNFEIPEIRKRFSRWRRAIWTYFLFKNLIRFKSKFDILHIHIIWWGTLLVALWARWKKIPIVYESILFGDDTPSGIAKERFGKLKLRLLKNYKAILAISKYLEEDYRKYCFLDTQVFTIVNPVDVQLFSPVYSYDHKMSIRMKLGLPTDAFIMLFVGAVNKRKGVDVLIDAFIKASYYRPDLFLLIVGPINKLKYNKFIREVMGQLEKHKMTDRCIFTNLIQDNQLLADYYRASDAFVFPSNNEGLGNVVLEAMASELPVIVSKLPVLEKIIDHKQNGYYVPKANVKSLKDAIIAVSKDSKFANKIAKNARNYVQRNHNFTKWQQEMVEFYKKICDC